MFPQRRLKPNDFCQWRIFFNWFAPLGEESFFLPQEATSDAVICVIDLRFRVDPNATYGCSLRIVMFEWETAVGELFG